MVLGGSGVRVPLRVGELWTVPLMGVRGLRKFEMAVTARCDVVARGVLEGELVRDAGGLRDWLRRVMCAGKGVGLESVFGDGGEAGIGLDKGRLRELEEWMRMRTGREEEEVLGRRAGRRLAIMAA